MCSVECVGRCAGDERTACQFVLRSNGYINGFPASRLPCDAKLYGIGAGANEIRRTLIGCELFSGNA